MMNAADDQFAQAAIAEDGMPVSAGLLRRKKVAGGEPGNGQRPEFDERFPALIRDLYRVVGTLEEMFPGRPFTPDGHMVGSLAECYAEYHYDLQLYPCSHRGHDARGLNCDVEIKATQGDRVALRSGPERLLVFRLDKDGTFEEVYNGPGAPVWALMEGKPVPSNGQYQISLTALRRLMASVPEGLKLKRTAERL